MATIQINSDLNKVQVKDAFQPALPGGTYEVVMAQDVTVIDKPAKDGKNEYHALGFTFTVTNVIEAACPPEDIPKLIGRKITNNVNLDADWIDKSNGLKATLLAFQIPWTAEGTFDTALGVGQVAILDLKQRTVGEGKEAKIYNDVVRYHGVEVRA